MDLLAKLKWNRACCWTFHHEQILGTSLVLRFHTSSQVVARKAEQAALAEIARLEKIFSSFDPGSELRRWQGTQALSPELGELLAASEHWSKKTGGAFHPGVTQGLAPLWRKESNGCHTRLADTFLTLNAIAKGEIVDHVCDVVHDPAGGVFELVVNIGGDLCVRGERRVQATVSAEAENAPPLSSVWLCNQALATSGTARRGLHLHDPRTGQPVTHLLSASVIAPSARVADVLATAFCVLSVEESLALAENEEGVACFLVTADGQKFQSPRWAEWETFPQPPPASRRGERINYAKETLG
ncbi:FAD:protein FMN transferase [Armatimonas sp.]|uniref:FAD:protein FMN transferase n=1 Tax=Armatimonas sp. TaxID=1872638 RepID=UPI0037533AB3